MQTLTRTGLAALLAAAAAGPAFAQSYGGQGYGSQGYGTQPYSGQGYDRQAYPPSTYDRGSTSGYQPSGAYPPDAQGANRYGQPGSDGQGGQDDPQELARRLNLTPSQQGYYDAYRRAFQPDEARARQEQDDMARMASLTTPQRLDMARASLARDRADFDRTDQATRAFYAQLSPGQRRTFDQLTAPQMDDDGQGGPSPTQPAYPSPR